MSPDDLAPELVSTLRLAKAWALERGASELARDAFLEAAMRLHPAAVHQALASASIEAARLERIEHAAASRALTEAGGAQCIAVCEYLCDAIEHAAHERARPVSLAALLAVLARRPAFLGWVRERYAPPLAPAPLKGTRELVERLATYHEVGLRAAEVLAQGGRCAEGLLSDLAERNAEIAARWAATPRTAPVRELYARWELSAPLEPESAAVEAALVRALCPKSGAQDVSVLQLTRLVGLDAFPCDATRVLAGIDQALGLGLVQRVPRLPLDSSLEDRLIGTEELLRDVEATLRREPLDTGWRARARRRLWASDPERGETT